MHLDNKNPQLITSFKAFSGPDAPVEVIFLIDAVNANFVYERSEIDKFLRANGGQLPTSRRLPSLLTRGSEPGADSQLTETPSPLRLTRRLSLFAPSPALPAPMERRIRLTSPSQLQRSQSNSRKVQPSSGRRHASPGQRYCRATPQGAIIICLGASIFTPGSFSFTFRVAISGFDFAGTSNPSSYWF